MTTEEAKKQAITFEYLSELVYRYAVDNFGEDPKYISMNTTDVYKLKGEIYRMGYILLNPADKVLRFMGIRVLECHNLEQGEVILSR